MMECIEIIEDLQHETLDDDAPCVMWLCSSCPALFRDENAMLEHNQLCHCFDCGYCEQQIFDNKIDFINHFRTTNHFESSLYPLADRGIQCDLDHDAQENHVLLCMVCKKEFADMGCLKLHYFRDHPRPIEDESEILFLCKIQLRKKPSYAQFDDEEPDGKPAPKTKEDFERGRVKCPTCKKSYRNVKSLQIHLRRQHAEPVTCPICVREFQSVDLLKIHYKRKHPDEKFVVVRVGEEDDGSIPVGAVKEEMEGGGFQCKQCDNICATLAMLNEHMVAFHTSGYEMHLQPDQYLEVQLQEPANKSPRKGPLIVRAKPTTEVDEASSDQTFPCKYCDKVFRKRISRYSHISRLHGGMKPTKSRPGVSKPVRCKECNRLLRNKEALISHLKHMHKLDVRVTRTNPVAIAGEKGIYFPKCSPIDFKCTMCDQIYEDKATLYSHYQENHHVASKQIYILAPSSASSICCCVPNCERDLEGEVNGLDYFKMEDATETHSSFFQCVGEKFNNYAPDVGHVVCKLHFRLSDFMDDGSLRPAATPSVFNTHSDKIVARRKPWKRTLTEEESAGKTEKEIAILERSCVECGSYFTQFQSFRHHMKFVHGTWTGDEDYITRNMVVCELCGKSVSEQSIHMHKAKHLAPPKMKCTKCGRSFQTDAGLASHQKFYCKDGRAICSQCGKEFGTDSGYRYHMSNVHGVVDKAWFKVNCPVCSKEFKNSKLVARHIKEVHQNNKNKRQCEYCEKKLPHKFGLLDHINAIHLKQWAYVCLKCQRGFTQKSQGWKHYKAEHQLKLNLSNMDLHMKTVPWKDVFGDRK